MSDPVAELYAAVEAASGAVREGGETGSSRPTLERPPKPEFGDYSTNAAMLLAPTLDQKPRDVAERLAVELTERLGEGLERVEVAGPGFLNLFLSDQWYRRASAELLAAGEEIGRRAAEETGRVLVEFVSANPTGPLTAAGGRHAAYGDSVVRLLEFAGRGVEREYYVNDAGGQMARFAASIGARMKGEQPPEDGYEGEYVIELAGKLEAEGLAPDDLDALERRGATLMLDEVRGTLERYGVEFDSWFSERSLHDAGKLDAVLDDLREAGHIYESDGATWLRTTSFGDDKDRVLLRAGGEPTYYLSDIAYHRDKLERGFERLIDVWGADHHGHVGRMKAAMQALGRDPEVLELVIMQFVHVIDPDGRSQMSKRKGEFVTLDELLGDIGTDATRFFMLQRSHDTTVDLDLELARRISNDNPVYYVQYAHARIASILRKAGEEKVEGALAADPTAVSEPVQQAEKELLKRLCELPGEARDAAERRAPHCMCTYAMATAADFHAFYRDCQVVGAGGEGVEGSRLALCTLAKRAIVRTLGLLGISAPESM
ncbi:MAG: arginine--tRNA ligase [Solirubrobacterales bacterium]|nr:arginine--tRNA ligase [Solirubrobacterales bacterium]